MWTHKVHAPLKCKFGRFQGNFEYPIQLPKDSTLIALLIGDQHFSLSHASFYTLLANIRKQFWIESVYSTVKKVVKNYLVCRRFNNKTVELNQNSYRDFRANPLSFPYKKKAFRP